MMTEIELQLRLDPEGRTAFDASASLASNTASDHPTIAKKRKMHDDNDLETAMTTSKSEQDNEVNNYNCTDINADADADADADANADIDGSKFPSIDYSSKTVCTALSDDSKVPSFCLEDEENKMKFLDELSFDCEVSGFYLLVQLCMLLLFLLYYYLF